MSTENSEQSDPKAKFKEALDRKKKSSGVRNNNVASDPKIRGAQTGGGAPKMFRRKSGSA